MDVLLAEIEPVLTAFDDQGAAADCERYSYDAVGDDRLQALVDLAEGEAAGSVGFISWARALRVSQGGGSSGADGFSSGDCLVDGGALVAVAEEGKTIERMTMSELSDLTALARSVGTNCVPAMAGIHLNHPAVIAVLD